MEREEIYRITNSGKVIPNGELIRCKDCEHRFDGEHNDKCCEVLMQKAKWAIEIVTDDDWFCAEGERRTDDA